jgi:hypothetical protein
MNGFVEAGREKGVEDGIGHGVSFGCGDILWDENERNPACAGLQVWEKLNCGLNINC